MKIALFFYLLLLRLRYRITIQGVEKISPKKQYLIFPNHQALVDPQIVGSIVGQKIFLTPVVSETFYNIPIFRSLFQMVGAVAMGDIQRGTSDATHIQEAFRGIEKGLKAGKNILLYPSGQLYAQGREVIKGKKTAFYAVQSAPKNVEILVIRTTGLWGSHWSKAYNGDTPNLLWCFVKSWWYILANALFLVPKREVRVVIENYTEKLKGVSDLNVFNQTLEDFYNAQGPEEVAYLKHYVYRDDVRGKTLPKVSGSVDQVDQVDASMIPPQVLEALYDKIASLKQISKDTLHISSNLVTDLYFDSLDMAEIKAYIQLNFPSASNPPVTELKTIGDLSYMAVGKSTTQEALKPCDWTPTESRVLYDIISKNTQKLGENANILSLFQACFSHHKNDGYVYDVNFGLQTKKDFVLKAYLIAKYIKKIEGKYIGVMLPSVASASIVIIAVYLAGKIPVMLNWTLGEASLLHCVGFSKVNKILTSRTFYEHVKNQGTEKIRDQYVYLEDLLGNIPLVTKIGALISSTLFSIPTQRSDAEAVVLFTSGSESLPKAVSLTHKNILSAILGSLAHFPATTEDRLIGFLPPFHSFGFTINTIMSLLTGLKVAYTPSPNDSKTIVNLIKHTQSTIITVTPTFLKMILQVGTPTDLASLRYAVVGAEKCPESLVENFAKYCPNARIIEGYGITECSPIISINPLKNPKIGSVGLPIEGGEIKIISLEKNIPLAPMGEGMIYFAGENVFSGYLDSHIDPPFACFDGETMQDYTQSCVGKKYYKTGDLGYLDQEGYLYITGRMKRFVKIAGEMISLPFIEGILNKKYGSDTEIKLAIEAREDAGTVKIVLFSTQTLDLEEVSMYLRESGVGNLVKISEIYSLESIPLLGTGKTDYRLLKEMICFTPKSE